MVLGKLTYTYGTGLAEKLNETITDRTLCANRLDRAYLFTPFLRYFFSKNGFFNSKFGVKIVRCKNATILL